MDESSEADVVRCVWMTTLAMVVSTYVYQCPECRQQPDTCTDVP